MTEGERMAVRLVNGAWVRQRRKPRRTWWASRRDLVRWEWIRTYTRRGPRRMARRTWRPFWLAIRARTREASAKRQVGSKVPAPLYPVVPGEDFWLPAGPALVRIALVARHISFSPKPEAESCLPA